MNPILCPTHAVEQARNSARSSVVAASSDDSSSIRCRAALPGRLRWVAALLLAGGAIALCCMPASAADWPTYRHDNARTGRTDEKLPMPLMQRWVFKPLHGPRPAWGEPNPRPSGGWYGLTELRRVHFDDAFHTVAAGGAVFFASSADGKVYCLDLHTGALRWAAPTGAPVRLAPTVWNGRVYIGSDDGWVYCFGASDGKVVWKFRAAPNDQRVLGSGRMISLWPVRTGVLVDGGVAYFGAGVFPGEGVYLYALDAEHGKLLWCNDWSAAAPQSRFSPQGYLLASEQMLFVPLGRAMPAALDRKDGQLLYQTDFGHSIGGTYSLLTEDAVFTGTEELIAYDRQSRTKLAWFAGRQLVVTPTVAYLAADRQLQALDRQKYPQASLRLQATIAKRQRLGDPVTAARRKQKTFQSTLTQLKQELTALDQQIARPDGQNKPAELRQLKLKRDDTAKKLQAASVDLASAEQEEVKAQQQVQALAEELKEAQNALAACTIWQTPAEAPESMILAGKLIVCGGAGRVMAFDADDGKLLWSAEVEGCAKGLAVADGRLLVSSTTGAIYCFGSPRPEPSATIVQDFARWLPADESAQLLQHSAEQILQRTNIKRGYCLVLGCGSGRLAWELARRTELTIHCIDTDAQRLSAAQKLIDWVGYLGARITFQHADPARVPCPDYFANLIVSETAITEGQVPFSADEAFRMLKPLGSVICLGQPSEVPDKAKKLSADQLRHWAAGTPLQQGMVSGDDGVWLKYTRGPLPGAANWTHQYCDPGNTTCSEDQLVRLPLRVLWFGDPGPGEMAERHADPATPLAVNGRLFVQGEGPSSRLGAGENVIMAYDAYNGLRLWRRVIPGILRTGVAAETSNMVADDDSLFIAAGSNCLRLDASSGETLFTYRVPDADQTPGCRWGYVARFGRLLYGTRSARGRTGECLFALDAETGKTAWVHQGGAIIHTAIAIGDNKVFLVDSSVGQAERQAALARQLAELRQLPDADKSEAERKLHARQLRTVAALDATTGRKLWEKVVDLTDCYSGPYWTALGAIYKDGVLLLFGVYKNGHYWSEFLAGKFAQREIVALSGEDGQLLWRRHTGHRVRPLVVGQTVHAEPWCYDLRTGQPRMRVNPITGAQEQWQFARPGHHCGCVAASPYAMFFRSYCLGYYDLVEDCGTAHFGSLRPNCWINFIPANGLLLMPEGSSGCMCPFPNTCTVAFQHRADNRAWAYFSHPGPILPVKHLAINFGAPGDRKDRSGVLWLGYPRPSGQLVLNFKLDVSLYSQGSYFCYDPARHAVANTDAPWLFLSGVRGLKRCAIPVQASGERPARYSVRLAFAELGDARLGQRVFDIKLQDRTVASGFDIVKHAGGTGRAVVLKFENIWARDTLAIELLCPSDKPNSEQMPVLQAIEIIREGSE